MKKKYLSLILACILTTSLFVSGCGKTAEEPAEIEEDEDDEDDDHHHRDDKEDNKDDDEDKKPVIVEIIDDETLDSQLDVLADHLSDWEISSNSTAVISSTRYWISDLDHNGRLEVFTSTHFESSCDSENRIFEISKDGSGIEEIQFKLGGIDIDHPSVDFEDSNYTECYFDKDNSEFHYLFADYYAVFNEYNGANYVDFCLSDGKAQGDVYCAYENPFNYEDDADALDDDITYYTRDGKTDEDTYEDYRQNYPEGRVTREQLFGTFEGHSDYSYNVPAFSEMDRDDLKELLLSSYRVFTGELDFFDFRGLVNENNDNNGLMLSGEMMAVAIGRWGLCMSDTEGDVNYYDSDSEYYKELTIDSDGMLTLAGGISGSMPEIHTDIYCRPDGTLYADYVLDEKEADEYFLNEIEIVIVDIQEDNVLEMSVEFWGSDGYLGGSEWFFERISY